MLRLGKDPLLPLQTFQTFLNNYSVARETKGAMPDLFHHPTLIELERLQELAKLGEGFPDYNPNYIPERFLNPNYVAPDRSAPAIITIAILFPIMLVVVTARILIRRFWDGNKLGWDDYLIIPATVSLNSLLKNPENQR